MSARWRLLFLAVLLIGFAVAGGAVFTRTLVMPGIDRAETEMHRSEQLRLWNALVRRQQAALAIAAEEPEIAAFIGYLPDGSAAPVPDVGRVLNRLEARFGVDRVEIRSPTGATTIISGGGLAMSMAPDALLDDASATQERAYGYRQDASRAFVLSAAARQEEGWSVLVSAHIERILADFVEAEDRISRAAAFFDLRGQPVVAVGDRDLQARLAALAHDGDGTVRGARFVEIPLEDLAGRQIGSVASLVSIATVTDSINSLEALGAIVSILIFVLLGGIMARGLALEFGPLDRLIGSLTALAEGRNEEAEPERRSLDEAGRLSIVLRELRRRSLLLTTLEISRQRQRRRQDRFLRRQLTALAATLEGRDREALLEDIARLDASASRSSGDTAKNALPEADGLLRGEGLETALVQPQGAAQNDFANLAIAFENLSFRIRDQNDATKVLVAELNEALSSKNEFLLLQQQLDLARRMQLSILPADRPENNGVAVHGLMIPAREVGGDFYDVFELEDGQLAVIIADVSGKGVPAAFFSLITRTLLKAVAATVPDPAAAVARINDLLCAENEQSMFVTLFLCVFDPRNGRMSYVNAGHNPPMILRAGGTVDQLRITGDIALAILPGHEYEAGEETLQPGDLMVFYTDGVTEACDAQKAEFGEDRLVEELRRSLDTPTWMVPRALSNAIRSFENGAEQSDDLTVIALGYRRSREEHISA